MVNCSGFRTALGLLAVVGFAAAASAQVAPETGSHRNGPGASTGASTPIVQKNVSRGNSAVANPAQKARVGTTTNVMPVETQPKPGYVAPTNFSIPRDPPSNDECANATPIGNGVTPYDATGATTSQGMTCGFNVGNDVWFSYTAAAAGPVTISTCDDSRSYDTVMSIYDGACGGAVLGCDDDGGGCFAPPGGGGFSGSQLTINAVAGATYLIQVGCYNSGPAGVSAMHVSAASSCMLTPPPGGADEGEGCGNDTNGGCNSFGFTPIACGGSVNGTAWASGGTRDTDWFEFTVPTRSVITFRGQAQFPLQLFILNGTCPAAIVAAANGNACDIVEVSAEVCAGTVHLFAGNSGFDGNPCGALNDYWVQLVSCVPSGVTPPPNDDCGSATVVSVPSVTPFDTTAACNDFPGSCGASNASPDVWYTFTAPIDGTAVISTCNQTGLDTVLGFFSGCGTESVCVDDACGLQTEIRTAVAAGTQYWVRVAGFGGGTGSGNVSIDVEAPCMLTIPGGAADENEPCGSDTNGGCNSAGFTPIACGGAVHGTAWADANFRDTDWYQLDLSGPTTITVTGQAQFPLQLFVIAGTCPATILAAANGNACDIVSMTYNVCAGGTVYLFAGNSGFAGNPCGALNDYWIQVTTCEPSMGGGPANDNCANATVVSVPSVTPFDTTTACNDFPGSCGASAASPDVWYTFTAPVDGTVVVSTCNLTAMDTVLGFFSSCGTEVACVDDACGLQTAISAGVQQGVQYWVRVSGFGGAVGTGEVSIDICTLTPPPGGTPEGEDCGADTNGGCNSAGFTPIAVDGTPIYGIAWAQGGTRDTDWYEFTLPTAAHVTYTGAGEFPLRLFILDGNCPPAVISTTSGAPCGVISLEADLAAGTYHLFAGTNDFDGTPCGGSNDYWITLVAGLPCTGIEIPGNAINETEDCGADTNGGCNSAPAAYENVPCNQVIHGTSWAENNNRDTDWYSFTAPASGNVSFTVTSDFSAVYFLLDIPGGDCNALALIGQAHTNCGQTATLTGTGLTAGNTYYLFVGAGNADGSGIFAGFPCTVNYVVSFDIGTPCTPPCPCNFNHDAFLNSQDFFDFLACFFTVGCPNADYNNDTFVNSQDFFDFLVCFFAPPQGCP